jgi:hypothetical protein
VKIAWSGLAGMHTTCSKADKYSAKENSVTFDGNSAGRLGRVHSMSAHKPMGLVVGPEAAVGRQTMPSQPPHRHQAVPTCWADQYRCGRMIPIIQSVKMLQVMLRLQLQGHEPTLRMLLPSFLAASWRRLLYRCSVMHHTISATMWPLAQGWAHRKSAWWFCMIERYLQTQHKASTQKSLSISGKQPT